MFILFYNSYNKKAEILYLENTYEFNFFFIQFRVRCRNAGPVAVAEKSIAQIAEKFILRGYCPNCNQGFVDESSTRNHKKNSGHKVRAINSMEESVLLYCHSNEGNKPPSDLHLLLDQSKFSSLKRTMSVQESGSQDRSVKEEGGASSSRGGKRGLVRNQDAGQEMSSVSTALELCGIFFLCDNCIDTMKQIRNKGLCVFFQ